MAIYTAALEKLCIKVKKKIQISRYLEGKKSPNNNLLPNSFAKLFS
jgi:hypothetical protein